MLAVCNTLVIIHQVTRTADHTIQNHPSKYVISGGWRINLDILFNSHKNVQKRMSARARTASERTSRYTKWHKIKTKDHEQTTMHHGDRQTAITTATDVNLYWPFLNISLDWPPRNQDSSKGSAEIWSWRLINERGFCQPFSRPAMRPGAIAAHTAMESLSQAKQDAGRCAWVAHTYCIWTGHSATINSAEGGEWPATFFLAL